MHYRVTTKIVGQSHPAHAIVYGETELYRELGFAEVMQRPIVCIERRLGVGGCWCKYQPKEVKA